MQSNSKMRNFLCVMCLALACMALPGGSLASTSKKYNRYLAQIFNKYGSGGSMSFEGLEHLMYNLGLGDLEFSPTHTIDEHRPSGYKMPDVLSVGESDDDDVSGDNADENANENANENAKNNTGDASGRRKNLLVADGGDFKSMHDPKHRHPRHGEESEKQLSSSPDVCLSPLALMKLVIGHGDVHNPAAQVPHHNVEEEFTDFINANKISPLDFMKICPALLVQIDQNVCVKSAPMEEGVDGNSFWMSAVYAIVAIFILSASGLLGVILIPLMESIAYKEILNFLVAVAVGTLGGDALMHLLPHALSSGHSQSPVDPSAHDHMEPVQMCACTFAVMLFMYALETLLPLIRGENGHKHTHSHSAPVASPQKEINTMLDETKDDKKGESAPLTPVAFMVVIGDGLHNLTDGLAIGAAFAGDPVTGMATAFAVLCHELPHELGDFALLLQTGVSIKRAILLNIVSSVLSFIGVAVGLFVAGVHTDMVRWIYAGTAGSFLYIALADLIPAMGQGSEKSLKNALIQIAGIFVGGVIMYFIAMYEDSLRSLFQ